MFEQVWILWGLPLIFLPILIHLLNRLRFRSVNWAAMNFLLAATRRSTRQARIRQILILLCRVLLLALLIFALSRPLIGGWLGLAFSGPPETILLLLDRSASMELRQPGTNQSKREHALELISKAMIQQGSDAQLVLIENATLTPQELPEAGVLPQLPTTQATETAADLPAMLQTALDYLLDHETGKTEIWLVSDLQKSNWQPDHAAWNTVMEQFNSLKQPPKFRLLALPPNDANNRAVTIREVSRYQSMGQSELQLAFDLLRTESASTEFPVSIRLAQRQPETLDVNLESSILSLRQRVALGPNATRGWGRIILPGDANPTDNQAWFVYDEEVSLHSLVIATDTRIGRFLLPAAAAVSKTQLKTPGDWQNMNLQRLSLILWQGPLPLEDDLARLADFVSGGGIILLFPPVNGGGKIFDTLSWGPPETAGNNERFLIAHWNKQYGALADTPSGWTLPLDSLSVNRRRAVLGEAEMIAEFTDDTAFLTKLTRDQGQVLVCSTLPLDDWSDLHYSTVLVPMIQRLLKQGSERLSSSRMYLCGQFKPAANTDWRPLPGSSGDPRWSAGVFEHESQRVALNRPPVENSIETVPREDLNKLFGAVRFRMFEEKQGQAGQAVPSEIWRLLLYLMLFVLLIESLLTLPSRLTPSSREVEHAA